MGENMKINNINYQNKNLMDENMKINNINY